MESELKHSRAGIGDNVDFVGCKIRVREFHPRILLFGGHFNEF